MEIQIGVAILVAGYIDAESDGGSNEGEVLIAGSIEDYKREYEETVAEDCYNNISEGEVCDDEILNDEDSPYIKNEKFRSLKFRT